MHPERTYSLLLMLLLLTLASCDTVAPEHRPALVVEAWFDTAAPLPPIRVSSTNRIQDALTPTPAPPETRLQLTMGTATIDYNRSREEPLWFLPVPQSVPIALQGDAFELHVEAPGSSARASGFMPPPIHLEHVDISFPEAPISVVLLDSLSSGLDSLNLSVNATTGFIYPVQVSLTWMDDAFDGWVEARLQPDDTFSSTLIDFFLLPSQVFPESSATPLEDGRLQWEGVYAVPVSDEQSPLPSHSLRVILTRGDDRFARFITSRDAPERREPVSNVNGGLGFVGGISTDSTRIDIQR